MLRVMKASWSWLNAGVNSVEPSGTLAAAPPFSDSTPSQHCADGTKATNLASKSTQSEIIVAQGDAAAIQAGNVLQDSDTLFNSTDTLNMDVDSDDNINKDEDSLVAKARKTAIAEYEAIDVTEIEPISLVNKNLMSQIKEGFLGFAVHDISGSEEPFLEFGSKNSRPLDERNAQKLAASMLVNGHRRCNLETAIPLAIPNSALLNKIPRVEFESDLSTYPKLADIVRELPKVDALGGQHRARALKINLEKAKAYIEDERGLRQLHRAHRDLLVSQRDLQLAEPGSSAYTSCEHILRDRERNVNEIKNEVRNMKTLLASGGQWLVLLYDKGALTKEAAQGLAANMADFRVPKSEEDDAWDAIRDWLNDECRSPLPVLRQLHLLREEEAKLIELPAKIKVLEQRLPELLTRKRSNNHPEAPFIDIDEPELDYNPQDLGNESPDVHAQHQLEALQHKLRTLQLSSTDRSSAILNLERKLKYLEHRRDIAYEEIKKVAANSTVDMLLSLEHTKAWISRLLRMAPYFRSLPESHSQWIAKHMMGIYGGLFSRAMCTMFDVFDDIFRPPKSTPLDHEDIRAQIAELDRKLEVLDSQTETGFAHPDHKSARDDCIAKLNKLAALCRGHKYEWPDYSAIHKSLLEDIDRKWTTTLNPSKNCVGVAHSPGLRHARRRYAEAVYEAIHTFATRSTTENRDVWETYATRAKLLLLPYDDNHGLWPLPTAGPITMVREMLEAHQLGITEISQWFAPMALFALSTARATSLKDVSEMMFESLKHPQCRLKPDEISLASRALSDELFRHFSIYFGTIERLMSPGSRFEPPTRWLNRPSIKAAMKGQVVDVSGTDTFDGDDLVDDGDSANARPQKCKGKKTAVKAVKKESRSESASNPLVVPGDRAHRWLMSIKHVEAEQAKAARSSNRVQSTTSKKGKAKAKSQPTIVEDDEGGDSAAIPTRKNVRRPTNLATYATILDSLPDPLPILVHEAADDAATFTSLLKEAQATKRHVLKWPTGSPPMKLLTRTPLKWGNVQGHGQRELVESWIPAAILELHTINLYRRDFIQGHEGGYLRQKLEEVLVPFMSGIGVTYDWADLLRNDEELGPIADPESALSQIDMKISRFRQLSRREIERLLGQITNSFVASIPLEDELETALRNDLQVAVATPEIEFAVHALHSALHTVVEQRVFQHQHKQLSRASDEDKEAICVKYPHLQSPTYTMRPVPFSRALLPRQVVDPCKVSGALPFVQMAEAYRLMRSEQQSENEIIDVDAIDDENQDSQSSEPMDISEPEEVSRVQAVGSSVLNMQQRPSHPSPPKTFKEASLAESKMRGPRVAPNRQPSQSSQPTSSPTSSRKVKPETMLPRKRSFSQSQTQEALSEPFKNEVDHERPSPSGERRGNKRPRRDTKAEA